MENKVYTKTLTSVVQYLEEVPILVPVLDGETFKLPHDKIKDFKDSCGYRDGISNWIVPETMFGLRISPACWAHDIGFTYASPTWEAFHYVNDVFMTNIRSIIRNKSKNKFIEHLRYYRMVTYFNAVDTIGADYFWKTKREQGYI